MEIKLKIDTKLYKLLEKRFKNNEKNLMQFINEAINNQLQNSSKDLTEKEDGLESYLKKADSGSRAYGLKGQGW
jgi:hypothetical protein